MSAHYTHGTEERQAWNFRYTRSPRSAAGKRSAPFGNPELLVLDFDGVVCDGMDEFFESAWRAWHSLTVDELPASRRAGLQARFARLRPIVESGWEMALLSGVLATTDAAHDTELGDNGRWAEVRDAYIRGHGLAPDALARALDTARDGVSISSLPKRTCTRHTRVVVRGWSISMKSLSSATLMELYRLLKESDDRRQAVEIQRELVARARKEGLTIREIVRTLVAGVGRRSDRAAIASAWYEALGIAEKEAKRLAD